MVVRCSISFCPCQPGTREKELRARGADPAALPGRFSRPRRQTAARPSPTAEIFKARLNSMSQQAGEAYKSGQDASALVEEIRKIKGFLEDKSQKAASYDATSAPVAGRNPQSHPRRSANWHIRSRQPHRETVGDIPTFDFHPKAALELGESLASSTWNAQPNQRRALCRLHGRRSTPGARPHQLHARPAHHQTRRRGARLH